MEEEREKPSTCDACGYETENLTYCTNMSDKPIWWCKVCDSTASGMAEICQRHYSEEFRKTVQFMAYCTNMILDEIRKNKNAN